MKQHFLFIGVPIKLAPHYRAQLPRGLKANDAFHFHDELKLYDIS